VSIGELAKMTSVSTRTIRYYEELGILPVPPRTPGGTRRYPHEYVFYVEGAKILKQIGLGLDDIAELGRFALTGAYTSKSTHEILQRKLSELEHRIRTLTRLHGIVAEAASTNDRTDIPSMPHLLEWVSREGGSEVGRPTSRQLASMQTPASVHRECDAGDIGACV
jgi:MerR family copper efflux transcriptional regulator